ncbi:hypothetical protein [Gluconobacter oxydans]|uniref:hypothetical protein n=1 Tax=Gluconobacter oxydans TaxID=442 RepID=UPI001364AE1A
MAPCVRYLHIVGTTIAEIHQIFSAPYGGFFDVNSLRCEFRYQNPQMLLLETFLALYEVSGLGRSRRFDHPWFGAHDPIRHRSVA